MYSPSIPSAEWVVGTVLNKTKDTLVAMGSGPSRGSSKKSTGTVISGIPGTNPPRKGQHANTPVQSQESKDEGYVVVSKDKEPHSEAIYLDAKVTPGTGELHAAEGGGVHATGEAGTLTESSESVETNCWQQKHKKKKNGYDRLANSRKPAQQKELEKAKQLKAENETLKQQLQMVAHQRYAALGEITKLQEDNDGLRFRLSEIAGMRLMDGNPNIADLSDLNRPTKLGERFQQVYDDEWTNAFSDLTDNSDIEEEAGCKILYKIVTKIYKMCSNKAVEQMDNLIAALKKFTSCDQLEDNVKLSIKTFKEGRKKNYQTIVPDIQTEGIEVMHGIIPCDIEHKENLIAYANVCTELCWLMCIQDPPVIMITSCKGKATFNRDLYRYYTKSGDIVDFVIWPAVRLYEEGPVLQKGVAQGKTKRKKDRKSPRKSISEDVPVRTESSNQTWADPIPRKDNEDKDGDVTKIRGKTKRSDSSASTDRYDLQNVDPSQDDDMATDRVKETLPEGLTVADKSSPVNFKRLEEDDITKDCSKEKPLASHLIQSNSSTSNIEGMEDKSVTKDRDTGTTSETVSDQGKSSLLNVEELDDNDGTTDRDTSPKSTSYSAPGKTSTPSAEASVDKNETKDCGTGAIAGSASCQVKTSAPSVEVLEDNDNTEDRGTGANSASSVILHERSSSNVSDRYITK